MTREQAEAFLAAAEDSELTPISRSRGWRAPAQRNCTPGECRPCRRPRVNPPAPPAVQFWRFRARHRRHENKLMRRTLRLPLRCVEHRPAPGRSAGISRPCGRPGGRITTWSSRPGTAAPLEDLQKHPRMSTRIGLSQSLSGHLGAPPAPTKQPLTCASAVRRYMSMMDDMG